MNTAARRSINLPAGDGPHGGYVRGRHKGHGTAVLQTASTERVAAAADTTRVYVAAQNRLLREALSRMLARRGDIDVVKADAMECFRPEALLDETAEILLPTAQGNLAEDISVIRAVRSAAPAVRILVVARTQETTRDETEFFQYVRAGIQGYLPRDASTEDVIAAIRAVQNGEAVCPAALCASLFRFFEREATSLPSASVHYKLGLTRREQQIVPLIAQGLTNKEIANQFCLSEQTIKNHLYRMKHKTGAPDRLGIVQLCRTQGFLV